MRRCRHITTGRGARSRSSKRSARLDGRRLAGTAWRARPIALGREHHAAGRRAVRFSPVGVCAREDSGRRLVTVGDDGASTRRAAAPTNRPRRRSLLASAFAARRRRARASTAWSAMSRRDAPPIRFRGGASGERAPLATARAPRAATGSSRARAVRRAALKGATPRGTVVPDSSHASRHETISGAR